MADISKIKIGSTTYDIKDTTARNSINKIKYGSFTITTNSNYCVTTSAISYGITYTNVPHIFIQKSTSPRTSTTQGAYNIQSNAEWLMGLTTRIWSATTKDFKVEVWNRYATSGNTYEFSWLSVGA